MRFVFRYIDPKEETREFFFSIFITDADVYEIEECQPQLAERLTDPLLDDLNKTNKFSTFVTAMRKCFKESLEH